MRHSCDGQYFAKANIDLLLLFSLESPLIRSVLTGTVEFYLMSSSHSLLGN